MLGSGYISLTAYFPIIKKNCAYKEQNNFFLISHKHTFIYTYYAFIYLVPNV